MEKLREKKLLTLHFFTLVAITTIAFMQFVVAAKWNMPTPYGDGYFQTKNVREFAAEVKEKSGGEIDITVHSGASLFSSPEIFKAVRGGQAEIGELLMANLGNEDSMFNIDSLPFLASGYDQSKKLWDASRKELEKRLKKMGVVLLYAVPWPPQNFYTKDELTNVDFFKGRKLRAYNAVTSRMADLLGASPTTIQVPEIPQAFSTGIIDAMITSGATGVSSQSWDYIKYYTIVDAWMPKNMVFVNNRIWSRLSKKNKNILLDAAKKAETRGWEYSAQANEADKQTLQKNGIVVNTPNSTMLANLKNVGDQMTAEWLKDAGRAGRTVINNYKKSIR